MKPVRSATLAAQFDALPAGIPFLLAPSGWLSAGQVRGAADAAAAELFEHGAVPGDRIVIALRNGPAFRVLEQAVFASGLVRVALTPRLHTLEIAAIAVDCTAALVCCDPERVGELRTRLRELGSPAHVLGISDGDADRYAATAAERPGRAPAPEEVGILHYSSGTTGTPKGAGVTHAAWVAQTALALEQLAPIGEDDVVLAVAPMAHFGGSMSLNAAATGAATLMSPAFSARETLETVIEHGVTVLPLAPIMLARIAEEDPALVARAASVLRAIPYGGSPIDPERLLHAARVFPGILCQYYGLSETLAPVTALTPADHDEAVAGGSAWILASAGRVTRGTEVRLRGEHADATRSATAAEPGEVQVRSALVTTGYWGRADLTAQAIDADGWFSTADLAWFDDDARLRLVGRRSDMIVSGGFNVQPREVEDVIRLLPFVRDVAVVGVADSRWGERVHAAIVADGVAADEVAVQVERVCRAHLAAFKRPLSIGLVAELPRTALDKVDRKAIRARVDPD